MSVTNSHCHIVSRSYFHVYQITPAFVREAYTELAADDQARYEKLLSCEDQDMFAWFMRRSQPDDADLQRIIGLVLEHSRTRRA